MASRRARERQESRPWSDSMDHESADEPTEEDESSDLYLTNGDRIDTSSAWVMPGQGEKQ